MKKYLLLLLLISTSSLYAQTNGAYGELLLGRGYNFNSSDWIFSGKIGAGYNIDKNIGLEIGYEQFGQRRLNNIAGTSDSITANENATEIQTVLHFALNDNFSLIGKIGPAYVQTSQNSNDGNAAPGNYSTWRPDYALGASYVLDDFPGLEFSVMYSHIVKDNTIPDSDLYAAGLIFNF